MKSFLFLRCLEPVQISYGCSGKHFNVPAPPWMATASILALMPGTQEFQILDLIEMRNATYLYRFRRLCSVEIALNAEEI